MAGLEFFVACAVKEERPHVCLQSLCGSSLHPWSTGCLAVPGVPGRSEWSHHLSAVVDAGCGVEAERYGQPNGLACNRGVSPPVELPRATYHARSCCSGWKALRLFLPGCRFELNFEAAHPLRPALQRFEKLCLWPGATRPSGSRISFSFRLLPSSSTRIYLV